MSKLLTRYQSEQEIRRIGAVVKDGGTAGAARMPQGIPDLYLDSGKAPAYIARRIIQPFLGRAVLLLIQERGIWPSHENVLAFRKIRALDGGSGDDLELPGQLFSGNESEDAEIYVMLFVLFGWGFSIFSSGISTISVNHDGGVYCKNREFYARLLSIKAE